MVLIIHHSFNATFHFYTYISTKGLQTFHCFKLPSKIRNHICDELLTLNLRLVTDRSKLKLENTTPGQRFSACVNKYMTSLLGVSKLLRQVRTVRVSFASTREKQFSVSEAFIVTLRLADHAQPPMESESHRRPQCRPYHLVHLDRHRKVTNLSHKRRRNHKRTAQNLDSLTDDPFRKLLVRGAIRKL